MISLELSEDNTKTEVIINQTDPSNYAIFVMTNTRNSGTGGGYFSRETARAEDEVLAKQVVMPKDKRGIPGSREHRIHYLAATGALEQTFSTARYFVPTSREEEPDNYNKIQEIYVGKLHKLKGVRNRCVKYGMKDPLKIPLMVDETMTDPAV